LLELTGEVEWSEINLRDVVGIPALDRIRVDDVERTRPLSRTHADQSPVGPGAGLLTAIASAPAKGFGRVDTQPE
jgi:hypothetical protein